MFRQVIIDDEMWRAVALPTQRLRDGRYLGTYATASQFAYVASREEQFALVLVQTWFRQVNVVRVRTIEPDFANWPTVRKVPLGDTGWYGYEVCDE